MRLAVALAACSLLCGFVQDPTPIPPSGGGGGGGSVVIGGGGGGGGTPPPPPPPAPPPPPGGLTPAALVAVEDTFDTSTPLAWVYDNPNCASPWNPIPVQWKIDGLPATGVSYPTTAYQSAPNSMNFNNDTDYETGGWSGGSVTSPPVDISNLVNPRLRYWCMFETEAADTEFDQRHLEIGINGFFTIVFAGQHAITNPVNLAPCEWLGDWHQHEVPLNPAWGAVEVRFRFDSIDDLFNIWAGWFIDDFQIVADGYVPPVITTTTLPSGTVGVSYSAQLQHTGGVGAPSWSIVSGSLPPGLSLDGPTGAITGTPSMAGVHPFTVEVADGGAVSTAPLSILVNAASSGGGSGGSGGGGGPAKKKNAAGGDGCSQSAAAGASRLPALAVFFALAALRRRNVRGSTATS